MRRYWLGASGFHPERAHVQHSFDAVVPARFGELAGEFRVHVPKAVAGPRVLVQDAGEVDHRIAACEVGVQIRCQMDVRLDDFAGRHHQQGPRTAAPPREDAGRAPFAGERRHEVAADEA